MQRRETSDGSIGEEVFYRKCYAKNVYNLFGVSEDECRVCTRRMVRVERG